MDEQNPLMQNSTERDNNPISEIPSDFSTISTPTYESPAVNYVSPPLERAFEKAPVEVNTSVISEAGTKTLLFYVKKLKEEREDRDGGIENLKANLGKMKADIMALSSGAITPEKKKLLGDIEKLHDEQMETLVKKETERTLVLEKLKEVVQEVTKRSASDGEDGKKIQDPTSAFDEIKSELSKSKHDFENDLKRFQSTDPAFLQEDERKKFLEEKTSFKTRAKTVISDEIVRLKQVSVGEENNTSVLDAKRLKITKLTELLGGFDEAIEKHNPLLGIGNNPILSVFDEAVSRKLEDVKEEEGFYLENQDLLREVKDSVPEFKKMELLSNVRNTIGSENDVSKMKEMIEEKVSDFEKMKEIIKKEETEIEVIGDDATKDAFAKRKQAIYADSNFIREMKDTLQRDGRDGLLKIINENSNVHGKRIVTDEEKTKMTYSALYGVIDSSNETDIASNVKTFLEDNHLLGNVEFKDIIEEIGRYSEEPMTETASKIKELGMGAVRRNIRNADIDDVKASFDDWMLKERLQTELNSKSEAFSRYNAMVMDMEDIGASINDKREELLKENDPDKKAELNNELKKLVQKRGVLAGKVSDASMTDISIQDILQAYEIEKAGYTNKIAELESKVTITPEDKAEIERLNVLIENNEAELPSIETLILDPLSVSKEVRTGLMSRVKELVENPLKAEIAIHEKTTFKDVGVKEGALREMTDLQALIESREAKVDELRIVGEDIAKMEAERDVLNNILITSTDENEKKEAKKALRRLEQELSKRRQTYSELESKIPTKTQIKKRIDSVASNFGLEKEKLDGLMAIQNLVERDEKIDKSLYQKDLEGRFAKAKEKEFVGNFVMKGEELNKAKIELPNTISVSELKNTEADIKATAIGNAVSEVADLESLLKTGKISTKSRKDMNILTTDSYLYDAAGNKILRGGALLVAGRGVGVAEEGDTKEMVVEVNGQKVKRMMKFVTMEDGRQGYVMSDIVQSKVKSAVEVLDSNVENATLKTLDFYRSDNKGELIRNLTMNYQGGGAIGLLAAFVAIFFRMSDFFAYLSHKMQELFDKILDWIRKHMIQTFLTLFGTLLFGLTVLISQDGTDKLLFKNALNPGFFTTIRISELSTALNDINISLGTSVVKKMFYMGFNFVNGAFSLFLGGITYAVLILIVIEILKYVGQINEKELSGEGNPSENRSDDQRIVAKVKIIVYVIILMSLIFVNRVVFIAI